MPARRSNQQLSQVQRQWRLLLHITVNRYSTIPALAKLFHVDHKTIRRDLKIWAGVGAPVEIVRREDGPPVVRVSRHKLMERWAGPGGGSGIDA